MVVIGYGFNPLLEIMLGSSVDQGAARKPRARASVLLKQKSMFSELIDQLINGLLLFVSYLLIGVLSVLVFALIGRGWAG